MSWYLRNSEKDLLLGANVRNERSISVQLKYGREFLMMLCNRSLWQGPQQKNPFQLIAWQLQVFYLHSPLLFFVLLVSFVFKILFGVNWSKKRRKRGNLHRFSWSLDYIYELVRWTRTEIWRISLVVLAHAVLAGEVEGIDSCWGAKQVVKLGLCGSLKVKTPNWWEVNKSFTCA